MRIAVRSRRIQWCRRTIRGVWVLANQNAWLRSRAWQRGGGVHQPRFSGHAAFVSEPCALWKHLHYLTSYFCLNENMSSSFRLQFFSTVRNHDCTLWFNFLVHFTRRQASLAISNFEYAKRKEISFNFYIYSHKYTCVLVQDHLGVALRVFIHCARNGKKLQTVRPQRATRGVGLLVF